MKTKLLSTITLIILVPFFVFATVHEVTQTGLTFSPSSLNVNVGDVITWVWSSGTHTTTSTAVPTGAAHWDSPLNSTTTTFQYEVTVAGQYSYKCTPHESMGMVGGFTAAAATSAINNVDWEFSVYPNPTSSKIFIKSSRTAQLKSISIVNPNGSRVFYENVERNIFNEFDKELNINFLPNGTYLLVAENIRGVRKVNKIVISK